jgi:hypothetical protein
VNATGEAILTHPQPCGHIVYSYTGESQFTEAVRLFVSAGLRNGESALLVPQESHCGPIRSQLEADGFDVPRLEVSGRLVFKTAEAMLQTFMFGGVIYEYMFKTTIGDLIQKAKAASPHGQTRVLGEMVNLLWRSNPAATERLEQLWNEVIKVHSVALLCSYALDGPKPEALPASLLACHSAALSGNAAR